MLHLHFETAWAPPIPVVKKLLEMWPDLKLEKYSGWDEGDHYEIEYNVLPALAVLVSQQQG